MMRFSFLVSLVIAFVLLAGHVRAGSDYGDFAENIPENAASIVVAGGCFWCIEKDFEKLSAVYEAVSGFAGGTSTNPTYESYAGHREAVEIYYNPKRISFEELIEHFYRHVDYEDNEGQFCDRGHSYSPAIFVENEEQRAIAKRLAPATSVVPIEGRSKFWAASKSHQDFYRKRPIRYKVYRTQCGRDRRVNELNR